LVHPAHKGGTPGLPFSKLDYRKISLYPWPVIMAGKFPDAQFIISNFCNRKTGWKLTAVFEDPDQQIASIQLIAAKISKAKQAKKKLNCLHEVKWLNLRISLLKSGRPVIVQNLFRSHQHKPITIKKVIRLRTINNQIFCSIYPAVGSSLRSQRGKINQTTSNRITKIAGVILIGFILSIGIIPPYRGYFKTFVFIQLEL
jgi:hypothetical protein